METLTFASLKTFRTLLLSERASILGASSSKLDVLEVSDNLSAEDQAPLIHDQFVALHYRRQESEKLKKIGAALERLRNGGFGVCQACEEPIPRKRLLAIPWATHCVSCQERLQDNSGCDAEVGLAA
jgi:DnaK suppressor protein